MKLLNTIKDNKLIKLFGILFMTLNLAIVMVGGASYFYTLNVFKEMIGEYNVSSIENVRTLMDINLSSGEKLAQEIYLSVNLDDLANKTTLKNPQDRILITKLINNIRYGVDINNVVDSAYIFLSKSNTVVSNNGFYDAEFFYNNYAPSKDLSFEEWKNQFLNTKKAIYTTTNFSFSSHEISLTQYYKPFNSYSNDIYGCVVVNYDNQAIIDKITKSSVLSGASIQIRYIPTATTLLSSGDSDINDYILSKELISGQHILNITPFGGLIVQRQTSLNRDWEYLISIPSKIFYYKTNTLITIMLAFIFFQIILGALLSFFFSNRSYRPIRSMGDDIRAMAESFSITKSGNDMEDIHNITSKAISDYGKIKEEFDTVKPVVIKGFLTQLLHGNKCERDFAHSHLVETKDIFEYDGFICAKMFIEDCNEFVTQHSIEEMQLAKFVLTNITEEIFDNKISIASLDFDLLNVVFIFNIPWTSDENTVKLYFNIIDEGIKNSQSIIAEKFKIYTSVGISMLHNELQNLYLCHNQAKYALNQNIVSGLYGINYYNEHTLSSNNYIYSLEDEVYLINSAKTGDYAKVKEILDGIIKVNNHILKEGSPIISQCFIVDIVSTLLRVVGELNVPDDILSLNSAKLLNFNSYSKTIEHIYDHYNTLCNWINKNKKSHNSKLRDTIASYIKEHCLDNSLSLVSVADNIGINPTYLSVFIKEQLGDTFIAYVLDLRMKKAMELLRDTNLSLQDIAVKIGYANSGVFIRVFKKKFGYTPGTYRNHYNK